MGVIEEKFIKDIGFRQMVIADTRLNSDIINRMSDSKRDIECYNGKLLPYLERELLNRFSVDTVNEMPKISQINLTKKIANSKGSLYSNRPERKFYDVTDSQKEVLPLVYADMGDDEKMKKSDRYFELQKQNHLIITPKNKKLTMKVLAGHRLNVVPKLEDPESAEVYIISTFDDTYNNKKVITSDQTNQIAGDPDDYKAMLETHIVWTENYHFTMNGRGQITSEEIINEIAPIIPIVEISIEKDGLYWVDSGSEISRFGIEFCAQLSNWAHIVNLQGYAQAYLKGPEDLQPKSIKIGPNYILRLITNPSENKDVEFGYASPNSDLAGVKDLVLTLLSLFQSAEEVDPTSITGAATAQTFSSGLERLLAMIENFKPSKDAMSLYEQAEQKIFIVIKAWLDRLKNTDALDPKYYTDTFGTKGSMSINFKGPENVMSEADQLDLIERRIDGGTMSRVSAIMKLENLNKDEAIEYLKEIDKDESMMGNDTEDSEDDDMEMDPNKIVKEVLNGTTERDDVESREGGSEV
jgi:hypothetical protein